MAAPDLTPYVDLTLFDKDPQEVFEAALLDLQVKMQDWVPRETNVEVMLLEAMALEVAEAIFAINRLPGAVVQALLRLYDIDPDSGVRPQVLLEFTASDDLGHEIPAGTGARLRLPGGLLPMVFTTDVPLSIAPGLESGTVLATGDRFSDEANGIAPGAVLELVDSIIFVETVVTDGVVGGGAEPETETQWIERGVQRFSRLSETLVLGRHFETFALEYPAVERAKGFDNWNGAAGVPGDHPGHVTVALAGTNGAPLPGPSSAEVEAAMESAALANLDVHIIAPTITAVAVTTTVKRKAGFTEAEVEASVVAALEAYLDPNVWDWSATVRRNELISVIDQAVGVDYVATLTVPAADVVLTGVATLADAGVLTVDAPT